MKWQVFFLLMKIGALFSSQQTFMLDLSLRFQWQHNQGYCGEASLISAGLYYGQYVSQYAARQLIDPINPRVQTDHQVLLGKNAGIVAQAMKLDYIDWTPCCNTDRFLSWIKAYVLNSHPVIIGVYLNECLFYDLCGSYHGDPEYDHIVPVLGIGSNGSLSPPLLPSGENGSFLETDTLIISDNGLFGTENDPINPPGPPSLGPPSVPFIYQGSFGPPPLQGKKIVSTSFQADRRQANLPSAYTYSVPSDQNTYGIAILGVLDAQGVTIPVRVQTNVNYEYPQIQHGENGEPSPMPLVLTVTVTIPDDSIDYYLYRYDNLSLIPTKDFNANRTNAVTCWTIPKGSGAFFTLPPQSILSNEVAAYRCVPTTAP